MDNRDNPRPTWHARRLRALRRHLNMTQQQMARELGTRQQTISEWETGIYRPRGTSVTLLSIIAERAAFPYQALPKGEAAPDSGLERPHETESKA